MFKALDLFCKAGGASMGLHRAGMEVVGIDIAPQPNYPFDFIQGDAMSLPFSPDFPIDSFDLIWSGPPCQGYSRTHRINKTSYPMLVDLLRDKLRHHATAKHLINWVIENVDGAPLINAVELCGTMFDLRTYRHRYFECSFEVIPPSSYLSIRLRIERWADLLAMMGLCT